MPYCLGCATDRARAEGTNSPHDVDSDNLDTELTLGGGGIPVRRLAWKSGGARLVLLDEPLPVHLSRSHSTLLNISTSKYIPYSDPNMVQDNNTEDGVQSEEQPAWKNVNRDRGILTQEDRKYLLGKKEVSGQDERNTRYRIRQRIVNSILDMAFIFEEISIEDRERVFSDEKLSSERSEFYSLFVALSLIRYQNSNSDKMASNIEEDIEDAIRLLPTDDTISMEGGMTELSELVPSVSVDIEERPVDPHDIILDIHGANSFKDIDMTKQEASDLITDAFVRQLDLDPEGITIDHHSEVSEEDANDNYD